MSMRKQRGNPPTVQPQQQAGVITETHEYSLITPLAGGGASTGKADEVTIIRATEIRGELRFWWRACYGGHYKTIDEMKQAEDFIWGKANGKDDIGPKFAETIQIVVEVIDEGNEVPANNADLPDYAAFPLRKIGNEPTKSVYKNVRFRLTISFPEQKPEHEKLERDIHGTLWAWETFGGVGARTRRGFGALKLDKQQEEENKLPSSSEIETWITDKFAEFGINQKAPQGVPSLSKNLQMYFYKNNIVTTYRSWHDLIGALYLFRQKLYWSEKRDIKALKDQWNPPLQRTYNFPKAALGLPIVYYFPRSDNKDEFTLQGRDAGHDRLASSLILRPLACQDKQIGMVILLENHPYHPGNVQMLNNLQMLKKVDGKPKDLDISIETKVTAQDARMLAGENNVLKAFMKYLQKGTWQKEWKDMMDRNRNRQNRYPQNNNNTRNNNQRGNTH